MTPPLFLHLEQRYILRLTRLAASSTARLRHTPAQQGTMSSSTSSSTRVAPTSTTATARPGTLPVHPAPTSSLPTATSPAARSRANSARGVVAAQPPRYRRSRPAAGWAARPALRVPCATRERCPRPTTAPLATTTPTQAARPQAAAANARGARCERLHAEGPFPLL